MHNWQCDKKTSIKAFQTWILAETAFSSENVQQNMIIRFHSALQVAAVSINYSRFVSSLSFWGGLCWERSLVAPYAVLGKQARFLWCLHELGFLLLEFHDGFLFVLIEFVSTSHPT